MRAPRGWMQGAATKAMPGRIGEEHPFFSRLLKVSAGRDEDLGALEALKTVDEHRAVFLSEDILSDLDDQVRAHTQDVPIEGGLVGLRTRIRPRRVEFASHACHEPYRDQP